MLLRLFCIGLFCVSVNGLERRLTQPQHVDDTLGTGDALFGAPQSELEREDFFYRNHTVAVITRILSLEDNPLEKLTDDEKSRMERQVPELPGRGPPARNNTRHQRHQRNGPPRRSVKTSPYAVGYLPYSPALSGKDKGKASFTEEEEPVLSRQTRAVHHRKKNSGRMKGTPVDAEDEDEEPPRRPLKKDKAYYSYDVDQAAGSVKGYSKHTSPPKTEDDSGDSSDDVIAFDMAPPPPRPNPQMNPANMQRAMMSAMRQGRQQYMQTVAGDLPPQCSASSDSDGSDQPWVWAVGRPSNMTRYAYESEFAGRRMADQFAGGNANQLFHQMNPQLDSEDCYEEPEVECPPNPYRSYDGTCNNIASPLKGAAGTAQVRLARANYEDDISVPRDLPSARLISITMSNSLKIPNNKLSSMFNTWSQMIAHEVINTPVQKVADPNDSSKSITPTCCGVDQQCSHPACFPVDVPPNDPFYSQFGVSCMEFVRAEPAPRSDCKLGARNPVNTNTAYIDGSQIYGSDKKTADRLRAHRHGLMRVNDSPIVKQQNLIMVPGGKDALGCVAPNPAMKCPDAGDSRINQHTGLVAIHSLLLREHNRIATYISRKRPELSDETVFQTSRKIMGGILQHITYNEMVRVILGPTIFNNPDNGLLLKKHGYCDCYDEDESASIWVEFGGAAYRFHTLQSDWLPARDRSGKFFPLYQHFGNAKMFYKPGILDELLLNSPHDIPEKYDHEFGFIVQNQMFKPTDKPYGLDMQTLNIQRGRDCGMPSYLQMRKACKLPPITSFAELQNVMAPEAAAKISSIYRNVQDIDLFVGGVSENPVNGNGMVGPTFACILTIQFKVFRTADRFWYENEGVFTRAQLQELRKSSLAALLCMNTPTENVQKRPLLRDSPSNPIVSCEEIVANGMNPEPFLMNIKTARSN